MLLHGDSGILAYSGTQSQFCVLYSTPCNDLKLGFPITDHQQQPPELFELNLQVKFILILFFIKYKTICFALRIPSGDVTVRGISWVFLHNITFISSF